MRGTAVRTHWPRTCPTVAASSCEHRSSVPFSAYMRNSSLSVRFDGSLRSGARAPLLGVLSPACAGNVTELRGVVGAAAAPASAAGRDGRCAVPFAGEAGSVRSQSSEWRESCESEKSLDRRSVIAVRSGVSGCTGRVVVRRAKAGVSARVEDKGGRGGPMGVG